MTKGWRHQQLARHQAFETIDARVRMVARFQAFTPPQTPSAREEMETPSAREDMEPGSFDRSPCPGGAAQSSKSPTGGVDGFANVLAPPIVPVSMIVAVWM